MTINENLFDILEKKNLKQSELAKFLGLSTAQITLWKKRGTNPPIEYAANICKFLNISIYELLNVKEENELNDIYNKLEPTDKALVDLIFDKYRKNTSLESKIG